MMSAPKLRLLPLVAIACAGAALAGGYAYAAGWLTPARLTPQHLVNRLVANGGEHPGYRRNHAKGVCVIGYFDGNGQASSYSSAAVFGQVRTPVIGRFAIPGGNPAIADTSSPVRSLALQFTSANGEQWRTGMNSTPVFVVNTPQAFYENLLAARPDPATGKPDPAKVQAFFKEHPESAAFRQWVKAHPPSSSFVNTTFYSINAFQLVNSAGRTQLARWSVVPDTAYDILPPGSAAPNALQEDLATRLSNGPVHWHLQLQLAQPGDPGNDATIEWPEDRKVIDAGVLTLERAIPQDDGPCRDINFDPTILPRGIKVSDDPLLAARSGAYDDSYNARAREQAALHAK
jgi:catalase